MTAEFTKKSSCYFVVSILVAMALTSSAQLTQSSYNEIPMAKGKDFEILPVKNELILYRLLKNETSLILDVISLDTTLREQWKDELEIPIGSNYILAAKTIGMIIFLSPIRQFQEFKYRQQACKQQYVKY